MRSARCAASARTLQEEGEGSGPGRSRTGSRQSGRLHESLRGWPGVRRLSRGRLVHLCRPAGHRRDRRVAPEERPRRRTPAYAAASRKMNLHTRRFQIEGPAGTIEMLRDEPGDGVDVRGTAVIAHPHPLFAGTMENKVVQTLARAFVQSGWRSLRFNFRGVGASQGTHDEGRGETEDMLHIVAQAAGK